MGIYDIEVVYFLFTEAELVFINKKIDGPVKIGRSTMRSIRGRVRQIDAHCPLVVVGCVYFPFVTGKVTEAIAHHVCRDDRIKGEWFDGSMPFKLANKWKKNYEAHALDGRTFKKEVTL